MSWFGPLFAAMVEHAAEACLAVALGAITVLYLDLRRSQREMVELAMRIAPLAEHLSQLIDRAALRRSLRVLPAPPEEGL